MALLDLLGRRWSLRILWELRQGPATFRELQARCEGLSPSVLNTRMGELRQALLIDTGMPAIGSARTARNWSAAACPSPSGLRPGPSACRHPRTHELPEARRRAAMARGGSLTILWKPC